jgi:CRISPR-associated exonuclease Cas4
MHINATLINLYHICPRECWLHANNIRMEHTSDTVYDGKLLHETSYPQRADRYTEIELQATLPDGTELSGKIDFYDTKEKIIHETKRSDKVETAHEWQCRFYIWLLELNDIPGVHALLEYPKLRQTQDVWLSPTDKYYLEEVTKKVSALLQSDFCPARLEHKICKSCSYYDLCYVGEG